MPDRQKSADHKLISPLLDCNYSGGPFALQADKMKEKIEETIDREVQNHTLQHVSVYFRDLNNGPTMGINEEEKFTPASLLKVPLMIAYLKLAETKPEILQERKLFAEPLNDSAEPNIKPKKQLERGHEYSIEDLIERMVIYSDNSAANLLLENIDQEFLKKIYTDLGIEVPGQANPENFMTVKEYASFFRILYNASYLNSDMSEKALDILSKTDYTNGLKAGVPENVIVAQKFGEREIGNLKQMHNCGIIYHSKSPYLLCVMSRGSSLPELENIIRAISKTVYEEVDN